MMQRLSEEFKEIYFVQGQMNGRYPYSHSLLIGDYLIDTGISSKRVRSLRKKYTINNVISSHYHEDHISGNRLLKNARFLSHAKDKPIIEDVTKLSINYAILNTPAEELFQPFMDVFGLQNTKIDKTIEDNEIIDIGENLKLKIIHAPGHTAGHCCFYELNTKIAFLADIDLSRFPFYGCIDSNLIDFEESIEKLKNLDIEIAISGHKGIYKGVRQIKNELDAYLSRIRERDEKILSNFSENNSIKIEDLLKKNIIYKHYSKIEKEYEFIAEKIMIQKHFQKFLKNKLIMPKNGGYILR